LKPELLLAKTRPEQLFNGNPAKAKKQYHDLAKDWHPDVNKNPRASEVLGHINAMYDEALKRIANGLWEGEGSYSLKDKYGSTITIEYRKKRVFELGHMYLADTHVTYLVDAKHKDLFTNATVVTNSFAFASDKMRVEATRYLPTRQVRFVAADGRLGMQVTKTPDLFLLRDVLELSHGQIDLAHAAWMQSTLHNLACYLSYTKVVHHDISPDTFFVSPKHHSGALLGGWWYAKTVGIPVKQVPKRTFNNMPWAAKIKKVATPQTDLELIRATGREVVGPARLPTAVDKWFKNVANADAKTEYAAWIKALTDAFGKRKFTKFEVDPDDVYRVN
jgi:hypothetical protein